MTGEDIKKIRELMEFLVRKELAGVVKKLSSDEKKIYGLTKDKSISVKEIVTQTGFSAGKISNVWQKLADEGLLVKDGRGYRKVI